MSSKPSPLTRIVTVALPVPPFPSETAYVKLSNADSPASSRLSLPPAAYSNDPFAKTRTVEPEASVIVVPTDAGFPLTAETASVSPSGSESFASTLPKITAFFEPCSVSPVTTGGEFAPAIVTVTVATFELFVPSVMR